MAGMKKVYEDLIIINLYRRHPQFSKPFRIVRPFYETKQNMISSVGSICICSLSIELPDTFDRFRQYFYNNCHQTTSTPCKIFCFISVYQILDLFRCLGTALTLAFKVGMLLKFYSRVQILYWWKSHFIKILHIAVVDYLLHPSHIFQRLQSIGIMEGDMFYAFLIGLLIFSS